MVVIFWCCVIAWLVNRTVVDGLYAFRGKPNPRYELKKARAVAAGERTSEAPRYGTRQWWEDLYGDSLEANTKWRRGRSSAKRAGGEIGDLVDATREPRPAARPAEPAQAKPAEPTPAQPQQPTRARHACPRCGGPVLHFAANGDVDCSACGWLSNHIGWKPSHAPCDLCSGRIVATRPGVNGVDRLCDLCGWRSWTWPARPTGPAPAQPTQPAAPAATPTQPAQPAAPAAQPTQPAQPAAPAATPTQPAQPAAPAAQPTQPAQPAAPAAQPAPTAVPATPGQPASDGATDTRPLAPVIPLFPTAQEVVMSTSDIAGLSAAQAFAKAATEAHQSFSTNGSEGYTNALVGFKVGPECVGAAKEAQEASAIAAAKWEAHFALLASHNTVKEAYQGVTHAGDKDYLLQG